MKKIALLISGYLRSFKYNIESLKENLLNIYDIDIYIHITNCNETKYLNKNISIDEINLILKPKIIIITDNINFNSDNNDLYNQNYKYYILNQKRIEIEKIENIKYDIVMKIRPDIYLYEKIVFNDDKDIIYIPYDNKIDKTKLYKLDDDYLCDMIAYGSSSIMNKYFDIYTDLNSLISKFGKTNETLLFKYLTKKSIKFELFKCKYDVILSLINTIAITGDSGVGKTTLTNFIKNIFNNCFVLECDRYHKWERGNDNWKKITHLNPEGNFITKMNNDVFDLKIGNNIYQVDYDHKTGKFTDKHLIESKENLIVCGLHTFYTSKNIIDLKIFIDAEDSVKLPWKIKRDVVKRGYTYDKILKQINDRKDDYEKYIFPQKNKADIIIKYYNNTIFNISTFNIEDEVKYNFKIGISIKYNIKKIICELDVDNIELDNLFYYITFHSNDLEFIIKNIILRFFNL
jgi:uridine kinase